MDERKSQNLTLAVIGWLWVGIPLCYGLVQLVLKIPALFTG
ncbi:MFS transporter small subunit [Mycobacterium sp. C31M]